MASRSKTDTRAAQRAERLAELKKEQQAEARRRNLMVGGVVGVVLVIVAVVVYYVTQSNEVEASGPGESEYGVTIGKADAPHQVVIYEDFLCPGCGQLEAATDTQLEDLAEQGTVRVDYRPFELLGRLGTYSARATAAFGVVKETTGDDAAKKFHDLLFDDQPAEDADPFPDAEWLIDKAVEAGADEAAVRPGIEAGENEFSDGATREAEDAGVAGTPTIMLDGERFTGSPEELLEEVD